MLQVSPAQAQEAFRILLAAAKDEDPGDEDSEVRPAALEALSTLLQVSPALAQEALPSILAATKDEAWRVRQAALEALFSLIQASPAQAQEALPSILDALKDEDSDVRQAAKEALSSLVQASPELAQAGFPILGEALKDDSKWARSAALKALSSLIKESPALGKEVFPILLAALKDRYSNIHSATQEALSSLTEVSPGRAQAGLPILREAAKDHDEDVRSAALKALSSLIKTSPEQVQEALPIILAAAKDKNYDVRQAALKSLSILLEASPEQAQEALPSILAAAKDEDSSVHRAALEAFSSLIKTSPEQAKEAFPSILAAAKDEAWEVRQAALGALWSLIQGAPTQAQEALTIIREVFTAEDGSVSEAALGILLQASLEQLLAHYWSKPDASLIPYIHPRLYHTPLVVSESSQRDKQQVILYATAGKPERYLQPAGVVQDFVGGIKAEASQIEQSLSAYVRYDTLPKQAVIGKMLWERYYGHVGSEPSLPSNIEEVMNSPCPFWREKQVKETHLLALIPSHVAGKPLTLDYLGELIKSPKGGGYGAKYDPYSEVHKDIGSQSPASSYWILMTRDVLPGSGNKNYQNQCALVADHAKRTGLEYKVPGALEAAVVVLLHHVRSGERLYSSNPWTYTRCRNKDKNGNQRVVGGFTSEGLCVSYGPYAHGLFGVAGLRKF